MPTTDPQLKSNDCGISAVKTLFNLSGKSISRKYIEQSLPLEEKGSRIADLKDFLDKHGFETKFRLLDVNSVQQDLEKLEAMLPFILPIQNKKGLHYVVAGGLKGKKVRIFDPTKGREYYLSLQEIKKLAHFNKNHWDLAETEDKILSICSQDLAEYKVNVASAIEENGHATLFNKLTYFKYLKENFGFKDSIAEKHFLYDLLKNQDISSVPHNFKTLQYDKGKLRNNSPMILTAKASEQPPIVADYPEEEKKSLYWQLFKQLGEHRKLWYIYIFAALFSATTAQIAVFTNQILIDEVLPTYNINTLVLFAIGLGIYKLFDLGTTIYKNFVSMHLGNILDRHFLASFDEKINNSSLSYIQTFKKGDLMERVSDSLKLKSFFMKFFTGMLVDICVSIYSLGILFFIDAKLTMVVVAVMVVFVLWFKFITPYLKQNERMRYMRKADFLSKMMEKVDGLQVIKSFKIERFHSDKIFTSVNDYLKIQLRNGFVDLVNKIVVAVIIVLASVLIIVMLTKSAITTQLITLGQIVTFIALSSKIFSSLKGILDDNMNLQENEVILKRYLDFDEKTKVSNNKGIEDFSIHKIEFKNLNYGYVPNELVLKDINLKIRIGEKIKIEGQNGSGKSTFSKILTTLYHPNSGHILINSRDKKFYDEEKMRDKILLVTNEDILFNDTIYNNIALGKHIPIAEIIDKARLINFYDFIAGKEDGLEFMISENGKNLSTGQRKKILLLRAIFSTAEFIILDEVLSGMDQESRNNVERLIEEDADEKTYIIISHEPIHNINFTKRYKIKDGELNVLKDGELNVL
ncbi:ATP-binding cassette domain-containing protein [Flavobacterium sp. MAH-1]|uniref:ATP-binding cassette domain-containing protein n=1 Tax=Flavobacterium agri TaxID=2743471 RepID=A0A7Y8Y3Z1_9FLAO|nr:ATP-binding cassette domain-containing protein [Flavobacterium agri]NUY82134.1 ATP-binding cassette domain-containing protein [Flavobacterium agri]NYA72158.1 ATP-binding cassette domain-containing protein [Flavobacterium agri]